MPLPLLLVGGALVLTGGTGAAGGGIGISRMRRAKRLHADTVVYLEVHQELFTDARDVVEQRLAAYGEAKLDAMTGPMARFVAAFSKLKHVAFDATITDDAFPVDTVELADLRDVDLKPWMTASQMLAGGGSGYAAGAGVGALAQLAVGSLATASTGTAIGGLSGAAATNATLAWIGGGTLATGGGGVAAGTMVLSGVAVAPALFVGGAVLWHRGGKALRDAEANEAEVEEAVAKMNAARTQFASVGDLAERAQGVLERLAGRLDTQAHQLERVVARERDYRRLARSEQETVAVAAGLAKAVRTLVDLPLTTESGSVKASSRRTIDNLDDEA
ncbi:hypothetical protein C8N24_0701 [Solirubrobacter pauli]|uniref:Uncharacterized protein n=1 Tax=Solirubrobacter pauli TaxID=166793 RepID=A0A660L925_9ACTN|nr:hypothetical protein [Solirubrobacter pauli]RKQ90886.1 hypothetical protein C8N24_0701 [Solirubrobacter pauli]